MYLVEAVDVVGDTDLIVAGHTVPTRSYLSIYLYSYLFIYPFIYLAVLVVAGQLKTDFLFQNKMKQHLLAIFKHFFTFLTKNFSY